MSSGILFTTGHKFLSGRKKNGYWSGIGGKIENGETTHRAAIREALEEIFGIYDDNIINIFDEDLKIDIMYSDLNGYTLFSAPLGTLSLIARKLNSFKAKSETFAGPIPETIQGIIDNFQPTELKALRILDIRDYPFKNIKLDKYFKYDLNYINK